MRKEAIVLSVYIKFEAIVTTKIKGSDYWFAEAVLYFCCPFVLFLILNSLSITYTHTHKFMFHFRAKDQSRKTYLQVTVFLGTGSLTYQDDMRM